MWNEPVAVQIAVALLATISGSLYFFYKHGQFRRDSVASNPASKARSLSSVPKSNPSQGSSTDTQTSDVWEERRRRGIAAASLHEKKDADSKKPFGSSYYYAHNSSKTTGGYKDGLRMEDFTMNGPRLLSRNGESVEDDGENVSMTSLCDSPATSSIEPLTSDCIRGPAEKSRRTVQITRFLWDDPGDATKGIGTIRIDELPNSAKIAEFLPWKEASACIVKTTAMLINENEGVQVKLETSDEVDYVLRIPKLYGAVTQVEAVPKTKRLLVKLTKKKSLLDKSNLKAWPHPHKQAR
jgi:hypothetical protein